jgi:hypothetical protein
MLDRLGAGAPGVFCFAILTLLTWYIWRFIYHSDFVPPLTPQAKPAALPVENNQ